MTFLRLAAFAFMIVLLPASLAAAPHKNAPPPRVAAAETPAPVEHAAVEEHHEEESTGLPQMDVARFPGQIFWLTLTFMLTYGLMRYLVLPQVQGTLAVREGQVSADVAAARAKNEEAKRLMAEYEARLGKARLDAQDAVRRVNEDSNKHAAEVTSLQTGEMDAAIRKAEDSLSAQKQNVMAALQHEITGITGEIVQAIAGFTPGPEALANAIRKTKGS
jgi:F-type H+-transporting ATPase subunit b